MIFISCFFGVLMIVVFLLRILSCFETPDMLTYIGLIGSLCGVALTYYQVSHLKRVSEETQKAVCKTTNYLHSILTLSDITRHISYLRLVKEYITNNQYQAARLRLSDTSDFLPKINGVPGLIYNENEYKLVQSSLKANIRSLDINLNDNVEVNKNVFCDEIEKVVTFLLHIENQLIKKEYE